MLRYRRGQRFSGTDGGVGAPLIAVLGTGGGGYRRRRVPYRVVSGVLGEKTEAIREGLGSEHFGYNLRWTEPLRPPAMDFETEFQAQGTGGLPGRGMMEGGSLEKEGSLVST